MKTIYEVQNLSFAYKSESILENISLKINRGDFVGLVGNNGSGKTTLLKLLLNQLKPDKGQIVKAEDLKIGYIEQLTLNSDKAFPATALEIVMLGLYGKIGKFKFAKKEHKKLALSALAHVGLKGFEYKQISKLSGGQQQKVMIAKTLVEDPDFLILDEPMAGIDSDSKKDFYELLKHLNLYHDKTILIVTHSTECLSSANKFFKIKDKNIRQVKNV